MSSLQATVIVGDDGGVLSRVRWSLVWVLTTIITNIKNL